VRGGDRRKKGRTPRWRCHVNNLKIVVQLSTGALLLSKTSMQTAYAELRED